MLKIVQDCAEPNPIGASLLDEIVRDGARQMLAAALLAEVAGYVEAHRGEVDGEGRRLVVRNGFHAAREVTTAAGAVQVRQPRVNDKRIDEVTGERRRFSSAILPAWSRKSPRVAEVLPLLYLHGLSGLPRVFRTVELCYFMLRLARLGIRCGPGVGFGSLTLSGVVADYRRFQYSGQYRVSLYSGSDRLCGAPAHF
jgi:Transposase, Mutator family